jgi:hypothetical protein
MNELVKFYIEQNLIYGSNPEWNKLIDFGVQLAETNRKTAYDYYVATGVIGSDLEFNEKINKMLNLIPTKSDHTVNPVGQEVHIPNQDKMTVPTDKKPYQMWDILKVVVGFLNVILTITVMYMVSQGGDWMTMVITALALVTSLILYFIWTLPLTRDTFVPQ